MIFFRLDIIEASQYRIVTTKLPLDRESTALYNVIISCQDGGSPFREETVQLPIRITDINDNAPRFDQRRYQNLVSLKDEEPDDTWLVRVHATDDDEGINAMIRYEVHAEVRHLFMADPHTGEVIAAPLTDIRDIIGLEFRVLAYDMGSPRLTSTATIAILRASEENSLYMLDQDGYSFGVYENQPLNSEAGLLTVYSDYLEDDLEFSLDESSDAESYYVDPDSGRISTRIVLDRELQAVYYFNAFVSISSTIHTSTASVTIYVADTNDQPPVFIFPYTLNNTLSWFAMDHPISSKGTRRLTRIMATDSDVGDNSLISYGLEATEEQTLQGVRMDSTSGIIDIEDYFWETITGTQALLSSM